MSDLEIWIDSLNCLGCLHLNAGDMYQAIFCFEKIFCVEFESRSESKSVESVFRSDEFLCTLHLNLAKAYKAVGQMDEMAKNARLSASYCKSYGRCCAKVYLNLGIMFDQMKEFEKAINHFRHYCKICKKCGNFAGLSSAYGCLGSAYARLGRESLSTAYHNQQKALAEKNGDAMSVALAHEMSGESLCLLKLYDKAIIDYRSAVGLYHGWSDHQKLDAVFKLAAAYMKVGKIKNAMDLFQKVVDMVSLEETDIRRKCELNIATILQNSGALEDLQSGERSFRNLADDLDRKLSQCIENDDERFDVNEWTQQLKDCYLGYALILSKLEKNLEALVIIEHYRVQCMRVGFRNTQLYSNDLERKNLNDITTIVDKQDATVLYYSLLPTRLLIWVFQPGKGIVCHHVSEFEPGSKASKLLSSSAKRGEKNGDFYACENRALPLCHHLLTPHRLDQRSDETDGKRNNKNKFKKLETNISDELGNISSDHENKRNLDLDSRRTLYDFLISPVEQIISGLKEGHALIFVTGEELARCSFPDLVDNSRKSLGERFRITVVSCFHILDQLGSEVSEQIRSDRSSELSIDDVYFETCIRVDPKRTSNPRLAASVSSPRRSQSCLVSC